MADTALTARLLAVVAASAFSQVEISRRAGQRDTWLGDLLLGWRGRGSRRGAEPSISTLQLLAQGLGVSLGELLGPDLLDEDLWRWVQSRSTIHSEEKEG